MRFTHIDTHTLVTNNCDMDTRFEINDMDKIPHQKSFNNSFGI